MMHVQFALEEMTLTLLVMENSVGIECRLGTHNNVSVTKIYIVFTEEVFDFKLRVNSPYGF